MSAIAAPNVPTRPVLADALPGSRAVADAAAILGGVGLTALLAQVAFTIPPSPVPVTGQTLAVGLVGATLGARRGMASLVLYALLGLLLPIYAEGAHGWSVVWGASGGYIVGFVFAAGAIGWLAARGADRHVAAAFAAFVVGQLLVFAFGLAGLKIAVAESWGWTIHNGFSIFIVGGIIKALIGAAALPSAWRLVGRLDGIQRPRG
ncbi:MAG TPA: biotin transporter BioY [Baekduia sp.]|uniref:biotin transporter BioY n=1 Tax=Baekduia sp. TaxID=2600305 RepID=UPI002CF9FFCF|nr:biotin transporter BioY [Baekduia sp.]HMJ33972.1 biotin transporter BioY [Baekduia sp.]